MKLDVLRLVFAADPHVRGTSPQARRDNYLTAICEKLLWTVRLVNQYSADGPAALIIGGDLFDSPDASYSVTAQVAQILKASLCPVIGVWGNHDLYGYNPATLDRTPLGLLARLGIIQLLGPDDGYFLPDYSTRITGRGFDWDVDKSIQDYQQKPWSPPAAVRIHVVHGMAVERQLPHGIRCTVLQEVVGTDIVLTGHEHIGYGIRKHGKTCWVNPGALGRLTARVEEMVRKPRVAVITVLPVAEQTGKMADYPFNVNLIDVPHKPGDEVLSRDALQEVAAHEERLSEFLDLLKAEASAHQLLDAPAMIRYLAEQKGFAEPIATEALRRLDMAREDLAGKGRRLA
jgi:DNA repair exonuclease SbcCD nuclease subunit